MASSKLRLLRADYGTSYLHRFTASSVAEHGFLIFSHLTVAIVGNFFFPFRPLSVRVIFLCTFFSVAEARLHLGRWKIPLSTFTKFYQPFNSSN